MDSELMNKLMSVASRGEPFEAAKVEEKYRTDFEKILEEIKSAPKGVMISPVSDWPGDEYDEIIEIFEQVEKRIENEKN